MDMKINYKSVVVVSVCLLFATMISSCTKDAAPRPDEYKPGEKTEKWRTQPIKDSLGNQYYAVSTLTNKLEIRVDNKEGKTIFSEVCPTIDSAEIPLDANMVLTGVATPNRYISINDATLTLRIVMDDVKVQEKYIQLLANINLETKKFYTKKYKVEKPEDWTVVPYNNVVHWYQNTLLVREGTDYNVNRGGGFMGLGQRGTQLVCYERDFSIRYTKDIDASYASYPQGSGGQYIPVSDYETMGFRSDGLISRVQIVTSVEDVWAGKKEIVWQDDLKKSNNIPADYSVSVTDYNIQGDEAIAKYSIYDEKGNVKYKRTRKWLLSNGSPRGTTTE